MDIGFKKTVTAILLTLTAFTAHATAQERPSFLKMFPINFSPTNNLELLPTPDKINESFSFNNHNGHLECNGTCNACGQCEQECCCSCWYMQGEVLFMDRMMSDSVVSFFDSSATGNFTPGSRALSANDFSFNQEPGMRVTLGRELDLWNSVELTYMGLQFWKSSAQTAQDPNQDINLVPLAGFSRFSDAYQQFAQYTSEFHSVEANYRHYTKPSLSILGGFRFMDIGEELRVISHDSPNPAWNQIGHYKGTTDNYLFGLQIGASWERPVSDRLMLNVNGKAGMFLNFVENHSSISNPRSGGGGSEFKVYGIRQEEVLASMIEINAMANYALTDNFSMMAGYNVMVVNGVALAVEQVPDGINTGSIVYHGPSIGFEYRR